MTEQYIAEIRMVSFNFAPKGWALCDGQLLPINQNQALFALLGTTYGGNGQTTFALPDLRGRIPVHAGNGIVLGERSGEEAHTLVSAELPAHSHAASASSTGADLTNPTGNTWAVSGAFTAFGPAPDETMAAQLVSTVGGSQPHTNLSPYLTLNFVIALQGIFPPTS